MEQALKSSLTRSKILDAAETEFSEKGLGAARVDEIARRAGVNKQLLYTHFGSKEGLYGAVLKVVYARLHDMEQMFARIENVGKDTIHSAIICYFEFLLKNPSFVRLVLWENLNYAQNIDAANTSDKLFTGISALLEKGIAEGSIRADLDIEQTVLSINMFCFSAFSNVNTVSKLTGKAYDSQEELRKRANHIGDVLCDFIFG